MSVGALENACLGWRGDEHVDLMVLGRIVGVLLYLWQMREYLIV